MKKPNFCSKLHSLQNEQRYTPGMFFLRGMYHASTANVCDHPDMPDDQLDGVLHQP